MADLSATLPPPVPVGGPAGNAADLARFSGFFRRRPEERHAGDRPPAAAGADDVIVYRNGDSLMHRLGRAFGHAVAGLTAAIGGSEIRKTEVAIQSAHWPSDMPPLRIAVLADFHVGSPHMSLTRLREIVDRTNAERPDIVLLAGDFMNQDEKTRPGEAAFMNGEVTPPDLIARELGRLRAPGGVIAVLGNHDNYVPAMSVDLDRALRRNGITVLHNQAIPIEHQGQSFWLAGLKDKWTAGSDIAAVRPVVGNDPYILLAHNPASFEDPAVRQGPQPGVMIAGHTHGGQVGMPWLEKLAELPIVRHLLSGPQVHAFQRWLGEHLLHAYGHSRSADGVDKYVTSGLGTSSVPIRANMRPEIAVLTLTGQGAARGSGGAAGAEDRPGSTPGGAAAGRGRTPGGPALRR